jgi:hypothetical protein
MLRTLIPTTSRTLRTNTLPGRHFSLSTSLLSDGSATTDKKHAVNKADDGDTANVQSANAKAAME